jgi:uncharacterized protein (TIGR02996 family)
MTPDELALLGGVLANPADDLPRVVYADWLEEHAGDGPCGRCQGSGFIGWDGTSLPRTSSTCPSCRGAGRVPDGNAERVEFIRTQCELAEREADGRDRSECSWGGTCCCRSHALRRRERELLASNHPSGNSNDREWAGRLPPHWSWDWSRGFVESVTCTAADWFAHGDELVWSPGQTAECPTCRRLGAIAYCADCRPHGTPGCVPRPCPPTAQPVTDVTFSDVLNVFGLDMRAIVTRWPTIRFHPSYG